MEIKQKGFTLVELAIVIAIIGLLIGGVLKGEELVANARLASTASRIHRYESAFAQFRSIYDTLPGDMNNATDVLQDCLGDCATYAGNNDGIIWRGTASDGYPYDWSVGSENQLMWYHLAAAGLIDDISSVGTNGGTITRAWGVTAPSIPIRGNRAGFAFMALGACNGWGCPVQTRPLGYYLHLRSSYASGDGSYEYQHTAGGIMYPNTAAALDAKIDDGRPSTGRALVNDADCCYWPSCAAADNTYAPLDTNVPMTCGMVVKIGDLAQ